MRIFEFDSYKKYVTAHIRSIPGGGRGELQKIAQHLGVHSSMVSQVIRGDKHLSFEQAPRLAEYLGLNELEIDFFVTLLEHNRAGTVKLRKLKERRLEELRKRSNQMLSRLPPSKILGEKDKALFYSNWYYSGIRLLTSIPRYRNIDAITGYIGLPKGLIRRVVEFLLSTGLCVEKNGEIEVGPLRTHVEADSPLVTRHHVNWRLKAIEHFPTLSDDELAFTLPMTISVKDVPVIRERIGKLIEDVSGIIERSNPEKLVCLSIDWFDVKGREA